MRTDKFYGLLDIRRALIASAPFWLAAASQDLHGQLAATDITTLRAHIATVNGTTTNDTITLAAGTYTLTGAPDGAAANPATGDLDITKAGGDLLIEGAGAATTIIDAALLDRVFHIAATTGGTITIRNLTIRNGSAGDDGSSTANPGEARGGGIYNESGTNLALEGLVIQNNSAVGVDAISLGAGFPGGNGLGGGVYSAGGTLAVSGCTFENNAADGGNGLVGSLSASAGPGGNAFGGGLYSEGGTVTITASTFTGNDALAGNGGPGYVAFNGGPGAVGGNARGGAIFMLAGGLTITASTLDNSSAVGGPAGNGGGGITGYFTGGFAGSGGAGGSAEGGGLYLSAGTILLQNSTISGNSCTGGDGGNGGNGGDATHPTLGLGADGGDGGNGGDGNGGGILAAGGTLTIQNCTIAANATGPGAAGTAGSGGAGTTPGAAGAFGTPGADAGGGLSVGGATATLASTLIADNTAAAGPQVSGTATASASLVESDTGATIGGTYLTGDPLLGILQNNGGPTRTHAITAGSIAFNAGSNPASLTTDQRGTGFIRVRDGTADIGAFEVQTGSGGGGGGGGGTGGGGNNGGGGGCAAGESRGPLALLLAVVAMLGLWYRRIRD